MVRFSMIGGTMMAPAALAVRVWEEEPGLGQGTEPIRVRVRVGVRVRARVRVRVRRSLRV